MFTELATDVCIPFAIKEATSLIMCIRLYCIQMNAYGHTVEMGRCDSTSQILPLEFQEAMAELHLRIVPAPTEEQYKNPVEASWRTVLYDSSGLLLGQRNLNDSHWFLAIRTACTRRSTVVNAKSILIDAGKTPWEILTKFPVHWEDLVRGFYGGLCAIKTTGPSSNQPLRAKNELAIYICPLLNGTHSDVVLLHGNRNPSIRGNVVMLQESVQPLTKSEYLELQPKLDDNGRITEFKSPVTDDFSSLVVSSQSLFRGLDDMPPDTDSFTKTWISSVNDNGWASDTLFGPNAKPMATSSNQPKQPVPFEMSLRSSDKSVAPDPELIAYLNVFGQLPDLFNPTDKFNFQNLGTFFARHGSWPTADQYNQYYRFTDLNSREVVPNIHKVEKSIELQDIWVSLCT